MPPSSSTCVAGSFLGVAGTARSDRKALNARDLDRCGWLRNGMNKAESQGILAGRGVGEAHRTDESDESRWRNGASLRNAHEARKVGRLWQH